MIDAEGNQVGVVPLAEALKAAQEATLDLVQITDSDPIVCKVMDYGKHVFEAKKQQAAARKNQVRTQVQVKLRNLTRFLEHGDKAKVTLRYRGREMAHQELGMQLLKRVEEDLAELGSVEQFPKMEGRQLTMVIAPKKKK